MKNSIKSFFPKYIRVPLVASFLIGVFAAIFLAVTYSRLQPVVPFFYSLAEANDYLADKSWLWFFPFFSLLISVFHTLMLRKFEQHHQRIIPQLFAWTTLLIQILLGLTFVRIIALIT